MRALAKAGELARRMQAFRAEPVDIRAAFAYMYATLRGSPAGPMAGPGYAPAFRGGAAGT